jgi:ribokinase
METGSEPADVVVVGSLNIDQVVRVQRHPAPGETVLGSTLDVIPGGKGANQALAAARCGARVALVGAVGGDAQAGLALSLLEAAGVDLSGVRSVHGPTGAALITVADDGENSIVVVPGANAAMDEEAVRGSADRIGAAAVVVLQGEIPAVAIAAAAALARRVVLNLAPVITLDPDVIRRADPLVVNEHEAALLLTQLEPGTEIPGSHPELVTRLRQSGPASVVLTRGAEGALCSGSDADADADPAADGGVTAVPAVPVPRVVDTSGAGDAFVGALSARLAAGDRLVDAVSYAVRVAAFSVQRHGTQPSYPTLEDELP